MKKLLRSSLKFVVFLFSAEVSTIFDNIRTFKAKNLIGIIKGLVIKYTHKQKERGFMERQGIDALKRMAQMAKSRLRKKVNETENKKAGKYFKIIYSESVDIKSKIITRDDAKLYQRVKDMLDKDEDITNPISRLIDYKTFNGLDGFGKERYLFDLVEKYKKYKQKYAEEKLKQIV